MDGDADDLALLLTSVRQQVLALGEDPRMTVELDGSRGCALREHVRDLLSAVEHRVDLLPSAGASSVACKAYARQMRQSIAMLRGAHVAIPWLSATRTPNINLGSLYLAEACAKILVGSDVDLVVVPDQEFMYSTTSWPFLDFISATTERIEGFVPTTACRPIVLNYPLTDGDRLLLHPILAHELGHAAVVDEHGLVAKATKHLRGEEEDEHAEAGDAESKGDEMPAVWNAWIEELLCDHLAIETMGPAYLLSFAAFVLPTSYHEAWRTHPANTLRLRLALDHLQARGWSKCMQAFAPKIIAWLQRIGADATRWAPPGHTGLHHELLRSGSVLQRIAGECVGEGALDPVVCEREAAEAATLLNNRILPVGLRSALEPRSILLGGWRAAIEAHDDEPVALIKALEDHQLQELLGKAIELSTVVRSWRQAV